MIELDIFVKFFRDFLDGWMYVIYVIICLFFLFLCIRSILQERKKSINIEKAVDTENVVPVNGIYSDDGVVHDSNTFDHLNTSTTFDDPTASIIQKSDDSVFHYSGDLIENNKK